MHQESEFNLRATLEAHRKNVAMFDRQFNDVTEFAELRHRALILREFLLCEIEWTETTLEKMGCKPDSEWGSWKTWEEGRPYGKTWGDYVGVECKCPICMDDEGHDK